MLQEMKGNDSSSIMLPTANGAVRGRDDIHSRKSSPTPGCSQHRFYVNLPSAIVTAMSKFVVVYAVQNYTISR